MTIWQFAAGEGDIDYSDVCIKYGVALVGPGELGKYEPRQRILHIAPNGRKHSSLILAEEVQEGDILLLKRAGNRGLGTIHAVGKVTGDYQYIDNFQDTQGWDVRRARQTEWRRVDWRNIPGIARGTLVRSGPQIINRLQTSNVWQTPAEAIHEVPLLPRQVTDNELIGHLVRVGLRVTDAEAVVNALQRVRRLAEWYRLDLENFRDVSETEILTNLVMPLLNALGWPEQRMKVQWKRVDIALLDAVIGHNDPDANDHCISVIEVKRMATGLTKAVEQAQTYARNLFPATCRRSIVTDGISYWLYKETDGFWNQDPVAHCNVLCLREHHPYLADTLGAVHLFQALLP